MTPKPRILLSDFKAYTFGDRDKSFDKSEIRSTLDATGPPNMPLGDIRRHYEMEALHRADPLDVEAALGTQSPSLGLDVYAVMLADRSIPSKSLLVALFQDSAKRTSNLYPGDIRYDSNDKKGYFLQQVRVSMSFAEKYALSFETPHAANETGQTTSEAGWSFDGSAGVFGSEGTGTGGGGYHWSNSTSVDYHQLEETDHSDPAAGTLIHEWNLMNYDPQSGSSGLFSGASLAEPPACASSAFQLIDQGAWQIPQNAVAGTLNITVLAVLTACEGFKAISTDYGYSKLTFGWSRSITLLF